MNNCKDCKWFRKKAELWDGTRWFKSDLYGFCINEEMNRLSHNELIIEEFFGCIGFEKKYQPEYNPFDDFNHFPDFPSEDE